MYVICQRINYMKHIDVKTMELCLHAYGKTVVFT